MKSVWKEKWKNSGNIFIGKQGNQLTNCEAQGDKSTQTKKPHPVKFHVASKIIVLVGAISGIQSLLLVNCTQVQNSMFQIPWMVYLAFATL